MMGKPKCSVEGCEKPSRSRGMCNSHYERWRIKGSVGSEPLRAYRDYVNPCVVDGCERPRKSDRMCKAHYDRSKENRPLDAPIKAKAPAGLTVEETFAHWASAEPTDTGCVIWAGGVLRSGYGSLSVNGSPKLAHRAAWEMANGKPVPAGLVVRHTCDVRLCVTPTHLILGTHADNSGDMVSRERQARGERTSTAKLTEDDVREIRRLRANGVTGAVVAEMFGIAPTNVSMIHLRRTWKHVA